MCTPSKTTHTVRVNSIKDIGNADVLFEDRVDISESGLFIRKPNRIPYTLSSLEVFSTLILFTLELSNKTLVAFGGTIDFIKEGRIIYVSLYNIQNPQVLNGSGILTGTLNVPLPCQFLPQNDYSDITRINWSSLNDNGKRTSANNNAVLRITGGNITIERTIANESNNIIPGFPPQSAKYVFTFNKQRFNMNAVTGKYLSS